MPAESNATKREEILSVASRLFYRQGFAATGIKQIIDEADVAKGTFYTHFASKEELGLAWLRARHAEWNGRLAKALAPLSSPDAKLLGFFDFLESWFHHAEFRGCAFVNTVIEAPDSTCAMRLLARDHKLGLLHQMENLAIQHFTSLPEEAARAKGRHFYLLFEGALVEAQNFAEVWPIRAAREAAVSLLAA